MCHVDTMNSVTVLRITFLDTEIRCIITWYSNVIIISTGWHNSGLSFFSELNSTCAQSSLVSDGTPICRRYVAQNRDNIIKHSIKSLQLLYHAIH